MLEKNFKPTTSTDDYLLDNARLNAAILFAAEKHAGQLRKTSTLPYILHPLETLNILAAMRVDTNLMIAGVLHDTLEDTDATYDDLYARFGTDVADLVLAHTDQPQKNWLERKTAEIQAATNSSIRVKMLILADKVSNLRTMARDEKVLGEKLWDCFSQPKEKQAWFYHEVLQGLSPLSNILEAAPFYREMVALYGILFK